MKNSPCERSYNYRLHILEYILYIYVKSPMKPAFGGRFSTSRNDFPKTSVFGEFLKPHREDSGYGPLGVWANPWDVLCHLADLPSARQRGEIDAFESRDSTVFRLIFRRYYVKRHPKSVFGEFPELHRRHSGYGLLGACGTPWDLLCDLATSSRTRHHGEIDAFKSRDSVVF